MRRFSKTTQILVILFAGAGLIALALVLAR